MPKNHDNIDILGGGPAEFDEGLTKVWRRFGEGLAVRGALVKLPILEKNVKKPWVFASFFSPVIDPPVESFFFFLVPQA